MKIHNMVVIKSILNRLRLSTLFACSLAACSMKPAGVPYVSADKYVLEVLLDPGTNLAVTESGAVSPKFVRFDIYDFRTNKRFTQKFEYIAFGRYIVGPFAPGKVAMGADFLGEDDQVLSSWQREFIANGLVREVNLSDFRRVERVNARIEFVPIILNLPKLVEVLGQIDNQPSIPNEPETVRDILTRFNCSACHADENLDLRAFPYAAKGSVNDQKAILENIIRAVKGESLLMPPQEPRLLPEDIVELEEFLVGLQDDPEQDAPPIDPNLGLVSKIKVFIKGHGPQTLGLDAVLDGSIWLSKDVETDISVFQGAIYSCDVIVFGADNIVLHSADAVACSFDANGLWKYQIQFSLEPPSVEFGLKLSE